MGVPLRSYGRYYGMAGCRESRWRPMGGLLWDGGMVTGDVKGLLRGGGGSFESRGCYWGHYGMAARLRAALRATEKHI